MKQLVRIVFILSALLSQSAISQSIGVNTITPDSSAVFDIRSDSKGLLIPRLTTLQRSLIDNPAAGLQIYNVDIDCFQFFNGTEWMNSCGFPVDSFTLALAGPDRLTMLDTIHLNGNGSGLGETGLWTVISGTGGSFSDSTDAEAIFTSNGNFQTYILRWTIFNPCGSTYDEIEVRFHRSGIYVSFLGSDGSGDGGPANPYRTIQKGINTSLTSNLKMVFISEGTYHESILIDTPSDTVHLLGGHYAHDWNINSPSEHTTVLSGGSTACTLTNTGSIPVTLESMHLSSSNGAAGGQNSVVIKASSSLVEVTGCTIKAGDGGSGDDGSDGLDGTDATAGSPGLTGSCSTQPNGGTGGAGGDLVASGGNGGAGGNGSNADDAGPSGLNGANGSGTSAGSGGSGGPGVGPCTSSSCITSSGEPNGSPGTSGAVGVDGLGGQGYSFSGGILATGSGANGGTGSGGGGGGGGGGCGGLESCNGGGFGYGNSGGGGGGGGAGGGSGNGGIGGGSSLGIMAFNTNLTVEETLFERGAGGTGGSGGVGGLGGSGAAGGLGLFNVVGGVLSLSGDGGDGAVGGRGGHGGGGGGGHSIGIARNGGTLSQSANNFIFGAAGSGGKSFGINGSPGTVVEVLE